MHEADEIRIEILDNVDFDLLEIQSISPDSVDSEDFNSLSLTWSTQASVPMSDLTSVKLSFLSESSYCEVIVLSVEYLKNGRSIDSSLVQFESCELKLLKYKVELPRGAKVTLFDDESLETKYLAWNIPCPTSFPNMTFLQVKAANGFEQQLTPSTGSQSIELYMELGRRYAVFGEIWTYSFDQVLWFADLRVQLADDSWQNCTPTAGEGGTIVTALPQ